MSTQELSGIVSVDLSKSPEIPKQAAMLVEAAANLQVNNEESYQVAAGLIQASAGAIASVEAFFDGTPDNPGMKVLAHRAHKAICDKVTKITAPWRTVRATLEPRMKTYRAQQEAAKRQAEESLRRQAEEAARAARVEAERIQNEAAAKAEALRREGDMRAAKAQEKAAAEVAQQTAAAAEMMAEVGVILPAAPKTAGLGESLPWVAEITDVMEIIKAVASGDVPLYHLMPKRGGGMEDEPLLVINQQVLNYIAKRMGKEDIGIKGVRGVRNVQLRFSKSAAVQSGQDGGGW